MPVQLVLDEYDRIDVPLPDELLESWRAQIDRAVVTRDTVSLSRRLAASVGEGMAKCIDWDLKPPTPKQLSFAAAIARRLDIPLNDSVLSYRGDMTAFLTQYADVYKARIAQRRAPAQKPRLAQRRPRGKAGKSVGQGETDASRAPESPPPSSGD
jgi:hypothetical protein